MKKVYVPPIKIQGIKTKLVGWIKEYAKLKPDDRWVEPFLGSGVVAFNIAQKKSLLCDSNPHIINFYSQLKSGLINSRIIKAYLQKEGDILSLKGQEHYYFIRERFNKEANPLDFLFLNRSNFNGMIRFNRKLKYNVPFGHKPERFSKSYITKIVNQVKYVEFVIKNNDFEFKCQDFKDTLKETKSNDFIYCDPPYIDRHVDYYDSWNEENEIELHRLLIHSNAKFMLSTWDYNKYRKNEYLNTIWNLCFKINKEHFYHIGAKESNRNSMMEALITNYTPVQTKINNNLQLPIAKQISMFDFESNSIIHTI